MKVDYFVINKLYNAPFKYLLITGPIDTWSYSLTSEQIISNIKMYRYTSEDSKNKEAEKIRKIESYIQSCVTDIEEEPHTIRFTCIPRPEYNDMSLVGMAKISNNGTCFIFSDDKEYLNLINREY